MITLYSGTPGSGKSLHVAKDIVFKLCTQKKPVICTFNINTDYLSRNGRKKLGKFIYRDYSEMTVEYLLNYARENHILGKESQTTVILDECQILFNPREFSRADRLKWITFFTQHRKLGFNFILITQFDRLLDRQIRSLIEYEVKHRKTNNYGFMGMLIPFPLFAAVTYWYGVKEKVDIEFFIYRKKYSKIYDSFMFFAESIKLDEPQSSDGTGAVAGVGGTRDGDSAAGRGVLSRLRGWVKNSWLFKRLTA